MAKIEGDGHFIGIDVGTQGTKTVIIDGSTGEVIGSARKGYPLIEKADGTREQNPSDWVDAVRSTVREALDTTAIDKSHVRGIGISGQQHGFVPLDEKNSVIRDAKLWNDTSTEAQCKTLIDRLGGEKEVLRLTGNNILAGYTASKVLWLKENEPEHYRRLSTILLPHDYINLYLTGERKMEAGDASGTAFFNVRSKEWSREVLKAIDDEKDLTGCLPPVIDSVQPIGFVRNSVLEELGLPHDIKVVVSSGGGDNMMGAIGTGNTKEGVVTVSLGTSGTIYAYSDSPIVDTRGEFGAFCSSTNGWLPLACTMNVTVATEYIKKLFSMDNKELDKSVRHTPTGAGGLILIPYFNGERTPNVPSGTGVFFGVNEFTLRHGYLARSAIEGVTLGIRYGLESMKREGIVPKDIRLTGGGSKSDIWCQIASDCFNTPTVTLEIEEAASFGAAIQAMWCYMNSEGEAIPISQLTDSFVKLREETRKEPDRDAAYIYNELFDLQNEISKALRKAFDFHRKTISMRK